MKRQQVATPELVTGTAGGRAVLRNLLELFDQLGLIELYEYCGTNCITLLILPARNSPATGNVLNIKSPPSTKQPVAVDQTMHPGLDLKRKNSLQYRILR